MIGIVLLVKDHNIAINEVRRQLHDLSNKIAVTLQSTGIFVGRKLEYDLLLSRLLWVSIALFINLHVICVMRFMLAT